jgi:hypothetical protein
MGSRRTVASMSAFLLLAVTGCGVMGGNGNVGGDGTSPREQRASRLVSEYVGEPVECKDNGGVNPEVLPDYPNGYSCYNEAGEFRNAMVSPDGVLLSVTQAVRLKPAEDS